MNPVPALCFSGRPSSSRLLSLAVVVQSFVGKPGEKEKEEAVLMKAGARKVILVLIALFLYALLLEWVGFVIVTLLLMVFLLRVIEKKPWWLTLLTGVTITVVAYLVFETALQSNLPKGLAGALGILRLDAGLGVTKWKVSFTMCCMAFGVALQPFNLMYCFFGVLIGTLVGVLPGLGPAAAIALLLPATFKVEPVSAVIMLSGIFYGAQYGGSTTSILVNIPGEASSVVTCLDGYQMALKGRAGPALGISAFGSFIAGTFSVIALTLVGPYLSNLALVFGPPEYFSMMVVGLMVLTYLTTGSMLKALMMAGVGLLLSGVGMDTISGVYRFSFGIPSLLDGIGVVPVAMGLFGISEVLLNLETVIRRDILTGKVKNLFPSLEDWGRSIWPIIRGSFLGFFLGIIPGGGAVIASFASYAIEKKDFETS